MNKKFFKTTINLVVLSENPIPDGLPLRDILEEAHSGGYVSSEPTRTSVELTPEQTAGELYNAGSEPAFFGLDDKGKQIP